MGIEIDWKKAVELTCCDDFEPVSLSRNVLFWKATYSDGFFIDSPQYSERFNRNFIGYSQDEAEKSVKSIIARAKSWLRLRNMYINVTVDGNEVTLESPNGTQRKLRLYDYKQCGGYPTQVTSNDMVELAKEVGAVSGLSLLQAIQFDEKCNVYKR